SVDTIVQIGSLQDAIDDIFPVGQNLTIRPLATHPSARLTAQPEHCIAAACRRRSIPGSETAWR
ncbi:hypothetical protein, partial [Devosia sp.]|uniref:hypothetical protein n=1 Tax=Devosia sp. TaxID=1871048 RepID=UPI00273254F4